MIYPGFIGGTALVQSPNVSLERTINLYLEINPPSGRSPTALYGTPGLRLFCDAVDFPHRGCFAQDGRAFFVAGTSFIEVMTDGTCVVRGIVANDGKMATFASSGRAGHQILVTAGTKGYIFDLDTNTFTLIVSAGFPASVSMCDYVDGYFIVLVSNSDRFQISTRLDGTAWNALNIGERSEASDDFVAFARSQRGIWYFGTKTTEVWYDNGVVNFPFAPIPGVFVEEGIAAAFSVARTFDNAICWIGVKETGGYVVRRADGYTPIRISTHTVETALGSYSTIADAIGYGYTEAGHEFYVLTFPTAQATWAYDAATKLWHERSYLNPLTGVSEAHLAISHCFCFGKHLVGDRRNGKIYEQALGIYSDNGDPIRSVRRGPYLGLENRWMYHNNFELEMETGVGLDGRVPGRYPQAMLRWTNDAHTWSNEYTTPIGQIGQYDVRARWRGGLGRARWRAYEVAMTDPVKRAWLNAYLDIGRGTS